MMKDPGPHYLFLLVFVFCSSCATKAPSTLPHPPPPAKSAPAPVMSATPLPAQSAPAASTAADVEFTNPRGVTVDGDGNIYVAAFSDSAIVKITPQGRSIMVAGPSVKPGDAGRSVELGTPSGVAVDKNGIIYVADADANTVWKIPPTGDVLAFTGLSAAPDVAKVDPAADFNDPNCVAVDQDGNVYVGDTHSHAVRKISREGVVTNLAGNPAADGANVDGKGAAARFGSPRGIAVDSAGVVYVADEDFGTVRKIMPDGTVTTLAGNGASSASKDGVGAQAVINTPRGLAVDTKGNVYVACTEEAIIRKITPDGTVTTLAGKLGQTGAQDGQGDAARFSGPRGLGVDKDGNIYVADSDNDLIRKITPDGTVTTVGNAP
jgi:sugar lactone lactonase YvrE